MDIKDYWTMEDWKARSKAYHHLNTNHSDDLNKVETVWRPDTVVEDALRHWHEKVDEWIYPAKSYFVAICYANWITEDFDQYFHEVLDDPDLLPHDPHFKRYSEDKQTYDAILKDLKWTDDYGMVPDVYEYYKEEMMFDKL